jgi:gas vesicle protein
MTSRGCVDFVVGFFLGGTLGAMAALLVAPKSGAELRGEFAEGGKKIRETTVKAAAELKSSKQDAREAFERAREALLEAAKEIKETSGAIVKAQVGGR